MYIQQNLQKRSDLADLKSNVINLDIYKLKKVPTNFSNLESKVVKLDVPKLVPSPFGYLKILKSKYLILLT